MVQILTFKLFEKKSIKFTKDLKEFQTRTNLISKIKDVLLSLEANVLNINSVLKIDPKRSLNDVVNDPEIILSLRKSDLQFSDLVNTKDISTFSQYPLKYVTVKPLGSTDLDPPIYLIIQIYQPGKGWTNLQLYYLNNGIDGFLEQLSSKTIIFHKKDTGKKWIYYSSNSGKNWQLQNIENETTSFTKILSDDDIEKIKKHPLVEFEILD